MVLIPLSTNVVTRASSKPKAKHLDLKLGSLSVNDMAQRRRPAGLRSKKIREISLVTDITKLFLNMGFRYTSVNQTWILSALTWHHVNMRKILMTCVLCYPRWVAGAQDNGTAPFKTGPRTMIPNGSSVCPMTCCPNDRGGPQIFN